MKRCVQIQAVKSEPSQKTQLEKFEFLNRNTKPATFMLATVILFYSRKRIFREVCHEN